ncbi:MAG TPA: imidazole glycerol phosphate synthase subunit HisF [Longimicrobiales bacterium]|nr:imidazole glycerol phosphate synthase subunit HisF [Longimicrobiales bacterium]
MLRKRVVVCLDVSDGRAVGDARFGAQHDLGDPVALAARYEREGADEIVFQDVSASAEGRRVLLDTVRRTAEQLFIPLTVSGGVAEIADIALALRAGADKVSMSTAAVANPELITEAAQRFGSQCIVATIDARLERRQIEIMSRPEGAPVDVPGAAPPATWYRVFTHAGASATQLDAVLWAKQCVELGAGEVLITSIDQEGQRAGYDLELIARVVEAVSVPVVAAGGAGSAEHIRDAFLLAGADAALASIAFHDGSIRIAALKQLLQKSGIPVRAVEPRAEIHEQLLS